MKKYILSAAACLLMLNAGTTYAQVTQQYGKAFVGANAVSMQQFMKTMEGKTEAKDVVVEGTISQVCQAEGCWIKMKNEQGEDVLVKFKDHAFLVPKDIAGKHVIVNGNAKKKVVSVDERKHMAEDAGATEAEIAKITKPKEELRIDATGILVD